jgi:hypothetical protein
MEVQLQLNSFLTLPLPAHSSRVSLQQTDDSLSLRLGLLLQAERVVKVDVQLLRTTYESVRCPMKKCTGKTADSVYNSYTGVALYPSVDRLHIRVVRIGIIFLGNMLTELQRDKMRRHHD